MAQTLAERISENYSELSEQLKLAADYVLANPFEVATRSMRSIAGESDLAPATYTRLVRAIGLDDYEDLKALCREGVSKNVDYSFEERAEKLQKSAGASEGHFIFKQANATIKNAEELVQSINLERLDQIVAVLHRANRVIVVGALASSGIANYMAYVGGYCHSNWHVLGHEFMGAGYSLRDVTKDDVLFVITKYPNSARAIETVRFAKRRGAQVIVLTDNHKCSAIPMANHSLIVPTDSPQFFSSYAATVIVIETIIGMLVMRGGNVVRERIAAVEESNRQIGEYWSDNNSTKRESAI